VVESAVVSHNGYSVVTSTVTSESNLIQVKRAARLCHPDAEHVDAALPMSMLYLRLVNVPFFTTGDPCITPDGVMLQIGKSGFVSLVVLQTPTRVVHDSPKSDTCTVYLNVTDLVSGARAKGLIGKTVQFGQYALYFRVARANPGSPLCSRCWQWGHPLPCSPDQVYAWAHTVRTIIGSSRAAARVTPRQPPLFPPPPRALIALTSPGVPIAGNLTLRTTASYESL
jgi:hypothetical protein